MADAFVIGVRGPVGSGKSTGGVSFIMTRAYLQESDETGWRRSRMGVIRNTTPELKSTTINTFLDWVPESKWGNVTYSSPIRYHIKDHRNKVDCEILFVALDRPKDVRKLLSLELTCAWVNEGREVPLPIIEALTGRVGRFPKGGTATYAQVYIDTNAPDDDHWWYETFETGDPIQTVEVQMPDGSYEEITIEYRQYVQPPSVLEVEPEGLEGARVSEPGYQHLGEVPIQRCVEAAGKLWTINPAAENLPNLRPGYYQNQLINKKLDYIQSYLQNKYTYVQEGRPAVPGYIPEKMGGNWPLLEGVPIHIGIDAGGGTLQPAAAIIQRHPRGPYIVQGEICATSMGMERFSDELVAFLRRDYPKHGISAGWMDPAAERKDEIYETRVRDYFVAKGLPMRSAPTQDVATRLDAIQAPTERFIDGKHGLLVNKHRAPKIHKGLSGAWYFRQIMVANETRYEQKPIKNEYSHPCEALGYALCGMGEAQAAKRQPKSAPARRPAVARTDFDPLAHSVQQ